MAVKIYLAASFEDVPMAMKTGLPVAPMAYYLSDGGELYMAKNMPYSDAFCPVVGCDMISYSSVPSGAQSIAETGCRIAVIEGADSPRICAILRKTGIRAFSSEGEESGVPCVMSTAISGGTLEKRISDEIKRHGEIAAEVELTRMLFTLPEESGVGKTLSSDELMVLSERYGKCTHFSTELMAWYFSFCENGRVHFVLYDNSESICRKLRLLDKMGVDTVFLHYPDVRSILPKIISGSQTRPG